MHLGFGYELTQAVVQKSLTMNKISLIEFPLWLIVMYLIIILPFDR